MSHVTWPYLVRAHVKKWSNCIYIAKTFEILVQNTGCPKKGIDKKLLFEAAHNFSSQFFNLFGFSISVNFV